MINTKDILETIRMIQDENLDIRTITMGISLLDCAADNSTTACAKMYEKITRLAGQLVPVGNAISKEYGIPIINKRVAVTPVAMIAAAAGGDPVEYALTLEKASRALGIDFIGGYSALVQKGFAAGDARLINSIPEALAATEHVCASVNIGSTKTGINMTPSRSWATSFTKPRSPRQTNNASARPNSLFSATRRKTTRLWRGRSTARVSRTA